MNKFGKLLTVAAVITSAAVATPAFAQTAAVSVSGGRTFDGDGPWTLGYQFTSLQAQRVTALGAYDYLGDGFSEAHEVGLWDSAGTLLASANVTSAGALLDGFRYSSISGLDLAAGGVYTVGASNFGRGDAYLLDALVSPATGITFNIGRYTNGSGLMSPTFSSNSGGYFGGNLQVAAVPEPATWAMMLVGFGMMGGAIRSRRRSTAVSFA